MAAFAPAFALLYGYSRIPALEILDRLTHDGGESAGGMGEVYEAAHARLSGTYAVKLLLAEIAANPEAFACFRREAEITSAPRHPNIVNVIAFNRLPDGRWRLDDPTFGLWIAWRSPGGTVVPMTLVGDDAERAVAEYLARPKQARRRRQVALERSAAISNVLMWVDRPSARGR